MNNKTKIIYSAITLLIIAAGISFYNYQIKNTVVEYSDPKPDYPVLSDNKIDIVLSTGEIILSVDNDDIFNWFKTESQLCDEYSLTTTPDRQKFCENKKYFSEKTKFKSITVSPDGKEIGFTLESEALTPDTVAGIFSKSKNSVKMLTNYYLGNEFIGFSPNGIHFIYKGTCWEAMCGFFVGEAKTFNETVSINNPEYIDSRQMNAEFIKWISDNEVEYKLQSTNSSDTKIERASF